MKRHIQLVILLAVCLGPLQCATLERLSLDEMVAKSTAIVRGKVTGSSAAFAGPVIYTHYAIQVSEWFKGSQQGTVDVVIPGGTANNLRQSFAGAPVLNAGDEFVFFLFTGRSGLTTVIGLSQGLFAVSAGGSADPTVTREATHELMLDRATARPVKDDTLVMKMSDLRARIAAGLGSAAK